MERIAASDVLWTLYFIDTSQGFLNHDMAHLVTSETNIQVQHIIEDFTPTHTIKPSIQEPYKDHEKLVKRTVV